MESLIEREYIERDKNDPNIIIYKAWAFQIKYKTEVSILKIIIVLFQT